jgi:hypothetical protein
MSDKKNPKPVPYRPNLPDLKPPQADELANIILRISESGRNKRTEFENRVEAPKRIQ